MSESVDQASFLQSGDMSDPSSRDYLLNDVWSGNSQALDYPTAEGPLGVPYKDRDANWLVDLHRQQSASADNISTPAETVANPEQVERPKALDLNPATLHMLRLEARDLSQGILPTRFEVKRAGNGQYLSEADFEEKRSEALALARAEVEAQLSASDSALEARDWKWKIGEHTNTIEAQRQAADETARNRAEAMAKERQKARFHHGTKVVELFSDEITAAAETKIDALHPINDDGYTEIKPTNRRRAAEQRASELGGLLKQFNSQVLSSFANNLGSVQPAEEIEEDHTVNMADNQELADEAQIDFDEELLPDWLTGDFLDSPETVAHDDPTEEVPVFVWNDDNDGWADDLGLDDDRTTAIDPEDTMLIEALAIVNSRRNRKRFSLKRIGNSLRDRLLSSQVKSLNFVSSKLFGTRYEWLDNKNKRRLNIALGSGVLAVAGAVAYGIYSTVSGDNSHHSAVHEAFHYITTNSGKATNHHKHHKATALKGNLHFINTKQPTTTHIKPAAKPATTTTTGSTTSTTTPTTTFKGVELNNAAPWTVAHAASPSNATAALNQAATKFQETYGTQYVLTPHNGTVMFMSGSHVINPLDQLRMNEILAEMSS